MNSLGRNLKTAPLSPASTAAEDDSTTQQQQQQQQQPQQPSSKKRSADGVAIEVRSDSAAAAVDAIATIEASLSDSQLTSQTIPSNNITGNVQDLLDIRDVATATATVHSPLEAAIATFFSTPSVIPFADESHVYNIIDVFNNPYWIDFASGRFASTDATGILYRPDIVDRIIEKVEDNLGRIRKQGLMIKGPQGIGKSHSIVNVVRKLESTGNYLVTFIPDCEEWGNAANLVNFICLSIGTTVEALGIPEFDDTPSILLKLIKGISEVLEAKGKQWIFVFDQINRIFARPEHVNSKDIGLLPFPFKLMKLVMTAGRITTIISASANNEISYKDRHDGFLEYVHQIDMTDDEYRQIYRHNNDFYKHLTGNVPLLVRKLLLDNNGNEESFTKSVRDEVILGLERHMSSLAADLKQGFSSDMCKILLGNFESVLHYDKKCWVVYDETLGRSSYRALTPLIRDFTRIHFSGALMRYIAENELRLIQVINTKKTTNDTRGRLFEALVVQRCGSHGVTMKTTGKNDLLGGVSIVQKHFDFNGSSLPELTGGTASDGVHVPTICNFPAVDMVWKSKNNVYGVQVHINSDHDDVAANFWEMCYKAKWFDKYNIFLLYLSPDQKSALKKKPTFYSKKRTTSHNLRSRNQTKTDDQRISIAYYTICSVTCLHDLRDSLAIWLNSR